jgi:hypothetical protein
MGACYSSDAPVARSLFSADRRRLLRRSLGMVADPFGHIWAISTMKEELTPEQVHERMTAAFTGD